MIGEESKKKVSNPRSATATTQFWASIWQNPAPTNFKTNWYDDLEEGYCTSTTQKEYFVTMNELKSALRRMPDNKSPGTDLITSFWIKNLHSLHENLLSELKLIYSGDNSIPEWLATSRTTLVPKNKESHLPNNFRPIACLNSTYKLYTSILNQFLEEHCTTNNILAFEQAG